MTVTFEELFGTTFEDTPLFWLFDTIEFDRVGLSTYVVETPMVLVALHEMFLTSFISDWVDNNGDVIGDNDFTVIYNYVKQYDSVKAIPLNKRRDGANIVWEYLWQLPNQTIPLEDLPIDVNNDAITITGSTVMVSKATLGDPDTVDGLLAAFAAYLLRKPVSGVTVRDGYIIEITTTDTQPYDVDDVVGG